MKINLTKKQYESLTKAVYLGNWVANAHKTGRKGDEYIKEYDDISDYVFSLAQNFGFSEHYEHDLEEKKMFEENSELSCLQEEYDDEVLWAELEDGLGTRDFYRKYSKEEREEMSQDEHFEKLMECIDKYEDEFTEYGLERLEIREKNE